MFALALVAALAANPSLEGPTTAPNSSMSDLESALDSSLDAYRDALHALVAGKRLEAAKAQRMYFEAQARSMELTTVVAELTGELTRLAPIAGQRAIQFRANRAVYSILEILRENQSVTSFVAIELAMQRQEGLSVQLASANLDVKASVLRALRVSALNMEPRRFAWEGRELMLHKFRQLQLLLDRA